VRSVRGESCNADSSPEPSAAGSEGGGVLGGVFWAAGVAWGPANSLALVDAWGGGGSGDWGYEDRALGVCATQTWML